MQRFEIMIEVKSTFITDDNSQALLHFYEALRIKDEDNIVVFYDLDIYDNEGDGSFVVKVLVDSEHNEDSIACSVVFGFDSEYATKSEFAQILPAF